MEGVQVEGGSPSKEVSVESQQLKVIDDSPRTIGLMTWLVLVLCGINECLYFPFLDNANELVTTRFCISYDQTGYYLAIPFVSASTLLIYYSADSYYFRTIYTQNIEA